MAQYSELPVCKATYDLLLAIFQFTKGFSKEYKYTVGESLKKEMYNRPSWAFVQRNGPMEEEMKNKPALELHTTAKVCHCQSILWKSDCS